MNKGYDYVTINVEGPEEQLRIRLAIAPGLCPEEVNVCAARALTSHAKRPARLRDRAAAAATSEVTR